MNPNHQTCPECGRQNTFTTITSAGGGYGPMLLPNLGGFMRFPKFEVVVCADCGLTRFYAVAEARARLPTTRNWRRA
jgi:predicted nucleic-acid-binding Zn-ribbon protein